MDVYEIRFARDVAKDLAMLTAYHRRIVLTAIEVQLVTEPKCRPAIGNCS